MILRIFTLLVAFCLHAPLFAETLIVYSGRGEALVGPLLERFEAQSGIKLDVRYNPTAHAAMQILQEGQDSPADVVFFQESSYLAELADKGLLRPINKELTELVDAKYRDADNQWVGVSARIRVLVYNTDKLLPEQLPQSLEALTAAKWQGRIGWAPSNASAIAHINVLRQAWGDEKTSQWLEAMKTNVSYLKNSQIVRAVANGEVDLGWVNHYYLHQLLKQNPNLPVKNYHFKKDELGNLLITSGVGITQHSSKQVAAEKLVAFLLSEEAQAYFNETNFEYPTRPELVKVIHAEDISKLPLAKVQPSHKGELMNTVEFLQELNVL